MNLGEMFSGMGLIGMAVMACLLALSIYSVSVIVTKYRRFRAASVQSAEFLPIFGRCLNEGKLQNALDSAQQHGDSHVAKVAIAGVTEFASIGQSGGDLNARVELATRALDRSTQMTLAELRRGLGELATIGSMAPFIGLFGTVVGIINAFRGIAASGSGGLGAVSGGIAEALIATALGIFVAIPAVMAFNYFTNRLERFQLEMNTTSAELVDFLVKRSWAASAAR